MMTANNFSLYNDPLRRRRSKKRSAKWWINNILFLLALAVLCNTLTLWHHHSFQHVVPTSLWSSSSSSLPSSSLLVTERLASFNANEISSTQQTTSMLPPPYGSCAICFFGLPRAFRLFVLPSIVRNVVIPNQKYGCDYFMHYFHDETEGQSRSGRGGTIHPEDVALLPQTIHDLYEYFYYDQIQQKKNNNNTDNSNGTNTSSLNTPTPPRVFPIVSITNDTNETFWAARSTELFKFRNTKNSDGNYTYFPWKERTYVWPTTLDNMVRQWHGIEAVWNDMMNVQREKKKKKKKTYRRVAMMRNDVVYITPIDIYELPATAAAASSSSTNPQMTTTTTTTTTASQSIRAKAFGVITPVAEPTVPHANITISSRRRRRTLDYDNTHVVIPNWAKYPINDRFIAGPLDAVQVWATQRFSRIDHYAHHVAEPGKGMHSETFLNATVFATIRNEMKNVQVLEDNWICFLRVRADGAIWIDDCHGSMVGFGGASSSSSSSSGGGDNVGHYLPPPGFPGNVMEWLQPLLPAGAKCRKRRLRDKVRVVIELICKSSVESSGGGGGGGGGSGLPTQYSNIETKIYR